MIQDIYEKPTVNIILIDERLQILPLRSLTRQGYPLSSFAIHVLLEVLAIAIIQEKGHPHWKWRGKATSIHRLCDLIFRKSKGICKKASRTKKRVLHNCRVQMKTKIRCISVHHQQSKNEIKNGIPFIIISKSLNPRRERKSWEAAVCTSMTSTAMPESTGDPGHHPITAASIHLLPRPWIPSNS